MTSERLLEIIGTIDSEELITRPFAPKERRGAHGAPRFLRRAASAAAAALLLFVVFTATAEAAGLRVVAPFVSWTGSTLRLDYAADLDRHEDAPEITADPSNKPVVSSIPSERIRFTSEEEFKARVGNMIRLPGEELGLEYVKAKGFIDEYGISVTAEYMLDGNRIIIDSEHQSIPFGTEYSSMRVDFHHVIRKETKEIGGIRSELVYTNTKNYLLAVFENESYMVLGNVEMPVLETVFASMMGGAE